MKWLSISFLAVCCELLNNLNASASTRYVDLNCASPTPPYTDWSNAATNIQDAVDAASPGDTVLVTNGVYATGGKAINGTMTNRVAVDKPIALLSVNGPELTVIQGHKIPRNGFGGNGFGNAAIRGVYLTNGAFMSGFTVADGATQDSINVNGGGIFCQSQLAVVTNCVISGNAARGYGGGVHSGTLLGCVISQNLGVLGGGGANQSCLVSCLVTSNSATRNFGGGARASILSGCLVISNYAGLGGGSDNCTLTNCTVVNNTASFEGAGVRGGILNNCIVTCNVGENYAGVIPNYCCTTPMPPAGLGNITNAPLFLVPTDWNNLRLQSNSPCINAGNNAYVSITNDLDGNPRIVGGTVDIGAYEYQTPSSILSYAWAQQYGLPTDGTADYADPDMDGMNNYAEWKASTNPTNSLSLLQLAAPVFTNAPDGIVVPWQSVASVTYYLQRSSDLAGAFSSIQSNLVGHTGSTSYTDITATNGGPYFYRVGVQ